jgi:hypothetical protein
VPATLFACQLFLPLGPLRAEFHRIIAAAPARTLPAARRAYYRQIVELLLASAPDFVRGNWDYTDEHDEATREYDAWCRGTIIDARERVDEVSPSSGSGGRYFFLTLLFLLERGSADDRKLEQATLRPTPATRWRRATFHELLETVATLDLEALRSDAVYLCPGADELGLTAAELSAARYGYLHRIE